MKEVYLLRHAQAEKGFLDHRLAPLSDVGIEQANIRREELEKPEFDLVVASPLLRAKQTAMHIAGLKSSDDIEELPTLFYDSDQDADIFDKTFEKIRHATTTEWFASDAGPAYKRVARRAGEDILNLLKENPNAEKVLIVGHAIGVPAIVDYLYPLDDEVLNKMLGETEGFKLFIDKGQVKSIETVE